jgi:hypothetical protein
MESYKFPPIGMGPAVWGPIFWKTMHIVSLGYSAHPTAEQKTAAVHFYRSLMHMIPCPICRAHYSHFMDAMPVEDAVGTRDDLINWVFHLHNKVNKELGKPEITFDHYVAHMRALAATSHTQIPAAQNATTSAAYVALGVALGVGAFWAYQKWRN